MGRVQLVQSVIQGMLAYSFHIYAWPVSLLKTIDGWIRNFIWSGDVNKRKLVTVAWHKLCTPTAAGGLGLRSVRKINEAATLKLCWDMVSSRSQWACFLKARYLKDSLPVKHYLTSSIWPGLKTCYHMVTDNVAWQLGDGSSINFWRDPWLPEPVLNILQVPSNMHGFFQSKICDFIKDAVWSLPPELSSAFPDLAALINKVTIPLAPDQDRLVWRHSDSGILSSKGAFLFLNPSLQQRAWGKLIWNPYTPPSRSFVVWRLMHNKLPTDDNLIARGCTVVSMCSLCGLACETSSHLFLACPFAVRLWQWLQGMIGCTIDLSSVSSVLEICSRSWSS